MNISDQNKENHNPNLNTNNDVDDKTTNKLQSEWVLWYISRKEKQIHIPYNERLIKIGSFNTLEDFFQYYVYLKSASDIEKYTDLAFFKKGHKPLWEECPNGGVWFFRMKMNDDPYEKDTRWERLIFALIGEQFDQPSILGAILSVRARETIFEIWFDYRKDNELKKDIVRTLNSIINIDQSTLFFKDNAISLKVKDYIKF